MEQVIEEIEQFLSIEPKSDINENICMLAGQFSSGKSKFLNLLFGFECLPVGTYETTDVPTYIRKGETRVFSVTDGQKQEHLLSEVSQFRKGRNSSDCIYISYDRIQIPGNVIFVDMPGMNSVGGIQERQFEEILNQSGVVFYFLGKSITGFDVLMLKTIMKSPVKIVLVRTKIDCIHFSEESVEDVIEEERKLLHNMYPAAELYFVSLEMDCVGNQIGELKNYINIDLPGEISEMKYKKQKQYVGKELRQQLLFLRGELLNHENRQEDIYIEKNNKKKIRTFKRNLEAHESKIMEGLEAAKTNYLNLGKLYIEKNSIDGKIHKVEIQHYIMDLMESLEKWYRLEIEDALRQMDGLQISEDRKRKRIIMSGDIDRIIGSIEEQKNMLFSHFTYWDDHSKDRSEVLDNLKDAINYWNEIIRNIFAPVFVSFHEDYSMFVREVIHKYEKNLKREKDILLPLLDLEEKAAIEKINTYLGVIENYVHGE